MAEGYAREVVNRVQQARKDQGFDVSDRIDLHVSGDEELLDAIRAHASYLQKEVLAVNLGFDGETPITGVVDGRALAFGMVKVAS